MKKYLFLLLGGLILLAAACTEKSVAIDPEKDGKAFALRVYECYNNNDVDGMKAAINSCYDNYKDLPQEQVKKFYWAFRAEWDIYAPERDMDRWEAMIKQADKDNKMEELYKKVEQ